MNIIWKGSPKWKSPHNGNTRHCPECRKSYLKFWNESKRKPCKVCGKLISLTATRCNSCVWKQLWKDKRIDVSKISDANKGKRFSPNTEFKKGNKPWNYNTGSITKLVRKIRELEIYKNWRDNILKRDCYTCRDCGNTFNRPHVDHFPISFISLIKINNVGDLISAEKCSALWDINNGRVLCSDCHKKTDTWGVNYANH